MIWYLMGHAIPVDDLMTLLFQFLLNMPHQALRLLEEVLLPILTHGSLYDRARTHYLWLRCSVAAAKNKPAVEKRKGKFGLNTLVLYKSLLEVWYL